jgi:hypothetical protein
VTALDPRPTIPASTWAARLAALIQKDRQTGTPADKQARALARDPYLWAHPQRIARHLAHRGRQSGSCANDTERTQPCDCPPHPAVLADLWEGKARMAAARTAAGLPLDDLDRQALDHGAARYLPECGATALTRRQKDDRP